MLRGFRWQFAAMLLSLCVFGLSIGFRFLDNPAPPITPVQTATTTTSVSSTTTPTPRLPTATVAAPQPPPIATNTQTDAVTTFREGLAGSITRLNPLLIAEQAEADVVALIYEGLTRINAFGEPIGALAERWVVSRDGLEYVFPLRDDVLWQDGTPFTAADVVYTFGLLGDPAYPGSDEQRAFWQTIEVQELNDNLVRFRLAQPLSSFPARLTVGLLPEHILRGTTATMLSTHPINLQPVGTGPYQLEALRVSPGERITTVDLRAAPVYQQRTDVEVAPTIQRMRFQLYPSFDEALAALNAGQVQGLATRAMVDRLSLIQSNSTNLYTGLAPNVGVLIFNWGTADAPTIFSDQRVRRGFQLALNRSAPIERFLTAQAIPAHSPLSAQSWGYNPAITWPAANSALASDLLQRIDTILAPPDVDDEGEGTEPVNDLVSLSILVPDVTALRQVADDYAAQWSQFGLEVVVETVDTDAYQQRLETGNFDMAIVEFVLNADPDIYAYWHVSQFPDGRNYGGMADDRLSELLGRARRESNGLNRVDLYHEFQQAFIERAAALPLYYPLFTYAVHTDVSGVQLGFISDPAERFRTITDWSLAP